MFPFEVKLLNDCNSLLEYERNKNISDYSMSIEEIYRRLIAIERTSNIIANDNYYEDKGKIHLSKYANLTEFLCQMPQNIAMEMLCSEGRYLYIRKEKLNVWLDILTYLPPTFFVAGYLYQKLDGFLPRTLTELKKMVDNHLQQFFYTSQPIAFLPELNFMAKVEGFNDLHIHLNGSTETDIVWLHMLNNLYHTIKEFSIAYIEKSNVRKFFEQIYPGLTPLSFGDMLMEAKKIRAKICRCISLEINGGDLSDVSEDVDYDLTDIWKISRNSPICTPILDEILFFLYTFNLLLEGSPFAGKFHHYLLIKGLVHRFTVMQKSQFGFAQFQHITESPSRFHVESKYKYRFLQLAGASPYKFLGHIEGRFSPANNIYSINDTVNRIYDGFSKAKRETDLLKKVELRLVAHFIKKKETEADSKCPIRHRALRHELRTKAFALIHYINSNPKHGKHIVGIDGAASEFDAGPEVFAPIFHFVKKNGINRCTFHVGEDFRHLVSGIRNIYEAVIFLEMSHADRLGHCTALGLSPQLWIERIHGNCILSQGEWLDNLVFLWYIIKESHNEVLLKRIHSIEAEISEYSYKVYNEIFPPYILAKVWKMRKYDPLMYVDQSENKLHDCLSAKEIKESASVRKLFEEEDVKKIMNIYHRNTLDPVKKNYDESIEIKSDAVITGEQMEILQDIVLEFLKVKGIVIETLPTSNLRIGYYNNIKEYHLHNWLKKDKAHKTPPIVMGTDDPGIFTTNLFNEYARAYLHLEENNVTSQEIYDELAFMHRNSIIFKFENHDK